MSSETHITNHSKLRIMAYTVALTESNRHLQGEYIPTCVDVAKEASNRLVSICGKYYTVILASGEMLEIVGKRAWNKWAKDNEYTTDF